MKTLLIDVCLLGLAVASLILIHNPYTIGMCIGAVLFCGWDVFRYLRPKAAAPKAPDVLNDQIKVFRDALLEEKTSPPSSNGYFPFNQ